MEVYQGGNDGNTTKVPQFPKGLAKKIIVGAIVLIVVGLGWSSFYTVQEEEQAAIITFGKYTETQEQSGLHFKLPYPIQQVVIVPASLTQRIYIGYRENNGKVTPVEEEALMITGDENIVSADAVVEWRVADLHKYLYNIENPEHFLRNSAIAAIRSVMGATKLDYAITEGKTVIQTDVKARLEELQAQYNTGIHIIDLKFQDIEPPEGQVQDAFKEVTNAREEKNTKINQAQKYVNERLPKARGEAQALIERAEGEKQSRILNAQGDVSKFNAVYVEYAKSPVITSNRLTLETLEKIMPKARVVLTDGTGNTVNYLPLNEFMKPSGSAASGSAATGSTTPAAGGAAAGTGGAAK
ncbi:MAG: HflK protein [Paenibacillaceae bacterium]|nr:HflK protein [Paenibacillaceae bacterium]